MYRVLAIMVVCVSMLAATGCKKEAATGADEKAAAVEKAACPADCAKPCCKKTE